MKIFKLFLYGALFFVWAIGMYKFLLHIGDMSDEITPVKDTWIKNSQNVPKCSELPEGTTLQCSQ